MTCKFKKKRRNRLFYTHLKKHLGGHLPPPIKKRFLNSQVYTIVNGEEAADASFKSFYVFNN